MSTDLDSGFSFPSRTRPAFRAAYRRLGDSTVVAVGGELDLATAPMLREILPLAIASSGARPRLFVDLHGVPFVDSWGLRPITDAFTELAGIGGELRIVSVRPPVRRLVALLGWEHLIPIRIRE